MQLGCLSTVTGATSHTHGIPEALQDGGGVGYSPIAPSCFILYPKPPHGQEMLSEGQLLHSLGETDLY